MYKKIFNKDFAYVNLGFIILSFTIVNFLIPSNLTAGGTTGIAIILFHLYKIPISLGFLILNLPLIFFGSYVFGYKYGLKTIFGISMITIYTEIMTRWINVDFLQNIFKNLPLAGAILGGILCGVSIGIIVLIGCNTGGTTIIAQILEKYFKIKIGTTLNLVDISIVALSGLILGSNSALLTIISLIICGQIVNKIKYNKTEIINERNS